MHSAKPKSFRTMPSATGGIARLACAQLRKLGKDVRPVLSGAGLTAQEADNPTTRLEVRAQIKVLELDFGMNFSGFTWPAASTCAKLVWFTM
jgi:hypothetical protein